MNPPNLNGQPFAMHVVHDRRSDTYVSVLSIMLGTGIAGISSAAYYSAELRPLAHTYGIWVLFAFAVASARPLRAAVLASTTFLATSVVVFFIGVKVFHDVKWAAAGSTLDVPWDRVTLWLIFALPAGLLLGLAGYVAVQGGWKGVASRAGVIGVFAAEAFDRVVGYGFSDPAVLLDSGAAVGLLLYFRASGLQLRRTIAVIPVTLVSSLLLLRAPDALEQLIAFR